MNMKGLSGFLCRIIGIVHHPSNVGSWEAWLERFAKASDFCCALPLQWDAAEGCLSKKRYPVMWWLTTLSFTLDNLYLLHTGLTLDYTNTKGEEIQVFAVHSITRWVAAIVLYALIGVGFAVDHVNEIVSMHTMLKVKHYGKQYKIRNSYVTSFYILSFFISTCQPFVGPVPQFLMERHSFRYWGSKYASRSFYDSPPGVIIFALNETVLTWICTFAVSYLGLIVYTYTVITGFWLRTIRILDDHGNTRRPPNTQYNFLRTNEHLMSWKRVSSNLKTFKLLSMQNRLHNAHLGRFIWPILQYLLISTHVGINVVTVKSQSWNFLPVFTLMLIVVEGMLVIFENNCFKGAAEMYELSNEFKHEIVRRVRIKLVKKLSRSLRPLRVEVGSCYYFKMSTFTTFMKTLVDYTASVLLAVF